MTMDECDKHFKAIRESTSPEDLRKHINVLLDVYPVLSLEFGRGSVFWRGRKANNQPYANISHMTFPPSKHSTVGRLNDEGQSCLYAATRRTTVFSELNVAEGDYVQLIGFRVKANHTLRIAVIGELFHVYKTGYLRSIGTDPDNGLSKLLNAEGVENGSRIVYIDAFFGSLLADKEAKHKNYIITRLLTAMAYEKSGADGLLYPSVQDHVGMNIAVLPEKFNLQSHVVCSQYIEIVKVREFGFFDYNVRLEATGINEAGDFEWSKPKASNIMTFLGLTKLENDFLSNEELVHGNSFLEMLKLRQN